MPAKTEIAHAVEELFAKEKVKVRQREYHACARQTARVTMRAEGRQAGHGRHAGWKKAVVTLTTGSPTIPSLEGA